MRGRYLKPRNAWEIAWNEALHSRDAVRAKKIAEELLPDPYKAAVNASDPERREAKVPEEEWYYEECRKYTQSELEDRKKLEEWANRYMPEEEEQRKKRDRRLNGSIL